MKKIVVLGYYGHDNIGDEQYKTTIPMFLRSLNLSLFETEFIDTDFLGKYSKEYFINKLVIVGGGDILCDYFLDKLNNFFSSYKIPENKPTIIGLSIGIPFIGIISSDKLKIFNSIYLRSYSDYILLKNNFCIDNIYYIPDISYYLKQLPIKCSEEYFSIEKKIKMIKKKKIIINLCNNEFVDEKFIQELKIFFRYLINQNYFLIFLPFSYNKNVQSQNDHSFIFNNFFNNSEKTFYDNSLLVNLENYLDTFNLYKHIDYCICMRYHACLFSIYNNIPFIPIYSTRKINNLLKDYEWTYSIKTNEFSSEKMITLFSEESLNNNLIIKILLMKINENIKQNFILKNLSEERTKINPLSFDLILQQILKFAQFCSNNESINDLTCVPNEDKFSVVCYTSYLLTNSTNSKYNYGLMDKMFKKDYNYKEEWKWVISDYFGIFTNKNPCIDFIDQNDYSNSHRFGWQYVFEHIKKIKFNEDIILDINIDKTFHWNCKVNQYTNQIPYKKDWFGFIHHTYDETFSSYNCFNLFKNNLFIESLQYCRGLIVLSNYLKKEIEKSLKEIGFYNHVKVYYICHPTGFDVKPFKFNNFVKNEDKKIIHIGSWLRNSYYFYDLDIPKLNETQNCFPHFSSEKTNNKCQKALLLWNNMSNIVPKENFLENFNQTFLLNNNLNNSSKNCSTNSSYHNNNWEYFLYKNIEEKINSVEIIKNTEALEYDHLLSENIVFLHLIDASAVNTIIECIVRNTPIFVNRLPAVEELLGVNYPLFYNDKKSIESIFNYSMIKKGYKYLKKLNKSKFMIENFIKELEKIINQNQN